jgi:hypothetical protein
MLHVAKNARTKNGFNGTDVETRPNSDEAPPLWIALRGALSKLYGRCLMESVFTQSATMVVLSCVFLIKLYLLFALID